MRIRSLSRMARLSALPVAAARRLATAGTLKVLGRLTDETALELHERNADQLFEILGGLKGGVMKFGQVMSIYEPVFPEAIAGVYRERLTRLQEAAPPEEVRRVLEEDLGMSRFLEFEETPVAAASLGQVHRAVWEDGREVAVKVQYAGARTDLTGDREAAILGMRLLTGLAAPGLNGRALATELMDRLEEELDYAAEAAAQTAFHEAYKDDKDIHVPAVVHQQGRVLISEWIDGTPYSEIIRDGDQETRNRAGLLLTRLMFGAIGRCGMMHGDPHPGNLRLLDDGRLGVLDFGAVHRQRPGTEDPIRMWTRIHLAQTGPEAEKVMRELGFLREGVRADPERLRALFERSGAPVRQVTFRFDRQYLREVVAGMTASLPVGLSMALPEGFVQANRAIGLGIGVLCQLEAEVPFLNEALKSVALPA